MPAYATVDDVAVFLAVDVAMLPEDTMRLIERASELVDHYTLDRAGAAANDGVEAVSKAVCAQVEHWLEIGEEVDTSGLVVRFYQIGNLRVDLLSPSDVAKAGGLAPRAFRLLFAEGLLYRGVKT